MTTKNYSLRTLDLSWIRFYKRSSSGPEKPCCKGLYSEDAIVLLKTCAAVVCRRVHLSDAAESLITLPPSQPRELDWPYRRSQAQA